MQRTSKGLPNQINTHVLVRAKKGYGADDGLHTLDTEKNPLVVGYRRSMNFADIADATT